MIIISLLLSLIYLNSLAITSNYKEDRKEIECWVFKIWDRISVKYSRNNRMSVKYLENNRMSVKYLKNKMKIRLKYWILKEWDKLLVIVSCNLLKAENL